MVKKKVKSVLLSNIIDFNEKKFGIEEESILYSKKGKRLPVNKGKEFSATDLLEIINEKTIDNGDYTIEPGGQLEWSSPPYKDLNRLESAFQNHKSNLNTLVKEYQLERISYSTEPQFNPSDIDLIKEKKYQLMDKNMKKSGKLGQWMMRNSASIQINFDISSERDIEEMAFIADCLHPVAAYMFSNSPFKNSKKVGTKNIRNLIWEDTDKKRCRNLFDHNIVSSFGLIDNYIDYFLQVPALFQLDENDEYQSCQKSIGEYLQSLEDQNKLYSKNIKNSLQQIFTNVRLKHVLEVRGSDRTPFGYELAPVAFWVGLLTDFSNRETILKVVNKWTKKDRTVFNIAANTLDETQKGPMGKTYRYWNQWVSELAIKGLKNRKKKEEVFLESFLESVFKNGPYSLQLQLIEKKNNS